MVNDPSTDHLICWSPSGTSFVIQNQAQFWYELLPLYYKHNNMNGFHKMSTVENGTMDADKDEIQFTHPFFVKDQPELLRNIKRKLIQFLVTLVQPSRMTVGVKRGYQLMLHESPNKKSKVSNNNKNNSNMEGPTIHELDSELDLTPNLYDEDPPVVEGSHIEINNDMTISSINASENLDLAGPEMNDENLLNSLENESTTTTVPTTVNNGTMVNSHKVFLNPSAQDTLLSNLMRNNFTVKTVNKDDKKNQNDPKIIDKMPPLSPTPLANTNMAIATRDKNLCDVIKSMPSTSDCYSSDLSNHIESTQNELEQFKDILNGYNSFVDANALLGELNKIPQNFKDAYLFHEESPVYDLNVNDDKNENLIDPCDPLVSGSELTPYGNNFDFTELFDDSIDGDNTTTVPADQ
ncbi:heat shock factor protein-like, partial [Asbolus verrucosus]